MSALHAFITKDKRTGLDSQKKLKSSWTSTLALLLNFLLLKRFPPNSLKSANTYNTTNNYQLKNVIGQEAPFFGPPT
jgi:hypothetical protein